MQDAIIDDYAPLLGVDGFAVYSSLCLMSNRDQYCWPSLARLARHWGKGKSTVSRAVSLMTALGLIHVKHTARGDGGTGNNVYYLLEPLPLQDALKKLIESVAQDKAEGDAPGDDTVDAILHMIPESWDPLRPRKATFATRADLETHIRSCVPRSAGGLGASPTGTGGPEEERVGPAGDRGAPLQDQGGPVERLGQSQSDAEAVPLRDPKVLPYQRNPIEGTPLNQHQHGAGGQYVKQEDIATYVLGEDEVLLEAGELGAQVVNLVDLVSSDVRASRDSYLPVETEPYYSTAHYLGLGGETWTPEELTRMTRQHELRLQIEALYRDIGACSLDEALTLYFTDDLVKHYGAGDNRERARVQAWLAYVHVAGESLTNPAGFLRTRLDSGQWPPQGKTDGTTGDPSSRRRLH